MQKSIWQVLYTWFPCICNRCENLATAKCSGKYLAVRLPCAGRGLSRHGYRSSCHKSTFLQVGHVEMSGEQSKSLVDGKDGKDRKRWIMLKYVEMLDWIDLNCLQVGRWATSTTTPLWRKKLSFTRRTARNVKWKCSLRGQSGWDRDEGIGMCWDLLECIGIQCQEWCVLCRAKEQMLLQGCLAAFGEAAVYFGGPHDLNNPGLARGS